MGALMMFAFVSLVAIAGVIYFLHEENMEERMEEKA